MAILLLFVNLLLSARARSMTWRVNFLRSKDAQKQLAQTSLGFGYNYTELYLKGNTPLPNQLYFKTDFKLL